MRSILLLAVLAADIHTARASCMQAELTPVLMTRRDTHLPTDGGVLVGYTYATSSDEREDTDGPDPSHVLWTATVGKKKVDLDRTQLAPGLAVYKVAGDFKLTTKKGKAKGAFTHDGKAAALTVAPKAKSIAVKSEASFRSSTTIATLTLSEAAPAEAVAIIVYDKDKKPVTYTALADTHDKDLALEIYRTGGHCGTPHPNEQGSVSSSSAYTFAYVDAFGRLSPTSSPVTAK